MDIPEVVLSSTSVFPEATSSAFELAARLGFDGVELMVGVDRLSTDVAAVEKLARYHGVKVRSVHAPTLLISQTTWGSDPWEKLQRSAEAVLRFGGDTVVVHPPFRWQRDYGEGFVEGIKRLQQLTGVRFAIENMFPWRTMAGAFQAYVPHWDPTHLDYDFLTLDLSHASTARQHALELVHAWGERLIHVHLTDGRGSFKDEHLLPGEGDQQAWEVVAELGARNFPGLVVLEVSTRRANSRHEREELLAQSLATTRRMLGKHSRA
ncbi:MAG: sugar phosphate isomerase/epimerase family protein [Arachnia sp.]